MCIALTRRTDITNFDGVNSFIALLAEGLIKLGHELIIASWCCYGTPREMLPKWFRETYGLDVEIPIHTLKGLPCIDYPRIFAKSARCGDITEVQRASLHRHRKRGVRFQFTS